MTSWRSRDPVRKSPQRPLTMSVMVTTRVEIPRARFAAASRLNAWTIPGTAAPGAIVAASHVRSSVTMTYSVSR